MSNTDLLINNSILYRCTQKYYDKQLESFGIGYGQIIFLMMINENEGCTLKELTLKGSFDKGTTTKGIDKLVKKGYVRLEADKQDKRSKRIYLTEDAEDLIGKMYLMRKEWLDQLSKNMTLSQRDEYISLMEKVVDNALQYTNIELGDVRFYGLQKLTLLDYPGEIACTLFTGGCNLKCPYCHNKDLVFLPENIVDIPISDIYSYLEKRKGLIDGICISGGEPLLHEGLEEYLREMKEMGYLIKLDTNGTFPLKLQRLVEEKLIDYVAVDIKNSKDMYGKTVGLDTFDSKGIDTTIKYLLENHIDYEFRTTVVEEFHDEKSMKKIGQWIKGAKHYYLQSYKESDKVIQPGLHAPSIETLERYKEILQPYVQHIEIRGVDTHV